MYGFVLSIIITIIIVVLLRSMMNSKPMNSQPQPQPQPKQADALGTFYDPIVPIQALNNNVPIYYPYNNPFLYGWERYPQSPAWTFGTYSNDGHFGGGQYTYKMS